MGGEVLRARAAIISMMIVTATAVIKTIVGTIVIAILIARIGIVTVLVAITMGRATIVASTRERSSRLITLQRNAVLIAPALALDRVLDPEAPLSPLARHTVRHTTTIAGAPGMDLQVESSSTPATRTVVKTSTSPTKEKVAIAPLMPPVLIASAWKSRQQMIICCI
jgi:hypothetical protein